MSAKSFVDTNILVYSFDTAEPSKQEIAVELVLGLWKSGQGVLSLQVLKEFFVTVTQRLAVRMAYEDARSAVEDLCTWECVAEDKNTLLRAMDLSRKYTLSFWDANIVASAVQSGCAICYSEDMNNGQVYEGVSL
jgi:predicted nucleic acid-binding protein